MVKGSVMIDIMIGDLLGFYEDYEFESSLSSWTIRAITSDNRFALCTRIDKRADIWYTIIDFEKKIRGPHDWVFNPYDMFDTSQRAKCLWDVFEGKCKISKRNQVDITILRHARFINGKEENIIR